MNVQNLLNQFVGTTSGSGSASTGGSKSGLTGLAGGAAAGGVMALLVGNKKARKFAGKAATVGGAAVLGGMAYVALRNWQQNRSSANPPPSAAASLAAIPQTPTDGSEFTRSFELVLIKTMISAANADGHIDEFEQSRIFAAFDELNLPEHARGVFTDLIRYPESPENLARGLADLNQKSEVYLMACFTIDVDTQDERAYLDRLGNALGLPEDLRQQLAQQASELALQAA
ncbi:tellurite resistance TerB family protein [Reinekea blandensis]|uniref:Tellurite resistance TerB family protein n=1 Tax=Reinekea blandensis MED297 TaxID=314283 RepID=A4BJM5_9GAMM|nr:tellurite resistance TerB family protein [Reinekea blandensis]EAR07665.1 hypothetical protein MED297_06484 [Reinekea sp. MED297] [Reinekea blandensis MED297]